MPVASKPHTFPAAVDFFLQFIRAQGHPAVHLVWVRPQDLAFWGRRVLVARSRKVQAAASAHAEGAYVNGQTGLGHIVLNAFAQHGSVVYASIYVPRTVEQAQLRLVNGLKLSVQTRLVRAWPVPQPALAAARWLRSKEQEHGPFLLGIDA
jgi:hypothetical protein